MNLIFNILSRLTEKQKWTLKALGCIFAGMTFVLLAYFVKSETMLSIVMKWFTYIFFGSSILTGIYMLTPMGNRRLNVHYQNTMSYKQNKRNGLKDLYLSQLPVIVALLALFYVGFIKSIWLLILGWLAVLVIDITIRIISHQLKK